MTSRKLAMGLAAALLLGGCPKGGEGTGALKQTVAEKVKVEFYVMSQCPFGVQVEQGIAPVLEKMGGDIDFSIDFIGQEKEGKLSSMHGQAEVDGDRVQLCMVKHAPNAFMTAVNCMNKNAKQIPGNWEGCAKEGNLDVAKIKACFEGAEGEGLLKASFDKAAKIGARGSPTIYLGGKPYSGGRNEQAFGRAICEAYPKEKPAYCASIPPPVKVPTTIVSDKRCKDCRPEFWTERMKQMFPGAEVRVVDYTDAEGKKLYEELKLEVLPAILFGKEVEKAENYSNLQRFLTQSGDYLSLKVGARFDPRKEICDNQIDDTGNGLIDCKDPDCKSDPVCMENCTNGKDDTENGLVDCDDPDCKNKLECRKEIAKKLDVFVMSQCPFGVKALNAMKEVLDNFDKKIEFQVHYIATAQGDGFQALHGQAEVEENIRGLCAIKNYGKNFKYMDYLLCRNENIRSPDWKTCTGKNGIATDLIEKCSTGEEGKKLLREDIKVAEALDINASPTWLANNKFKFSGIDAETIKSSLCARNKDLKNCDKKLTGQPPQQAGGGGGGACGQ